jgi:hypothetical protein
MFFSLCRQAIYARCDVASWDSQVDLFDFAVKIFGSVDIVVRIRLLIISVTCSRFMRLIMELE